MVILYRESTIYTTNYSHLPSVISLFEDFLAIWGAMDNVVPVIKSKQEIENALFIAGNSKYQAKIFAKCQPWANAYEWRKRRLAKIGIRISWSAIKLGKGSSWGSLDFENLPT